VDRPVVGPARRARLDRPGTRVEGGAGRAAAGDGVRRAWRAGENEAELARPHAAEDGGLRGGVGEVSAREDVEGDDSEPCRLELAL